MTSPVYPVAIEVSAAHVDGERLVLEVSVHNDADRALLVVEEIRRVEWDAATHTLQLWLGERDVSAQGTCRVPTLPKTRALPMRETVKLPLSLPRALWRLTPHADGSATVEHTDLREVEHVEVHVTVADGPFYPPSPKLVARTQARAPVAWGQCTTVRARVGTAPRSA